VGLSGCACVSERDMEGSETESDPWYFVINLPLINQARELHRVPMVIQPCRAPNRARPSDGPFI
jgi:hypothetical protein